MKLLLNVAHIFHETSPAGSWHIDCGSWHIDNGSWHIMCHLAAKVWIVAHMCQRSVQSVPTAFRGTVPRSASIYNIRKHAHAGQFSAIIHPVLSFSGKSALVHAFSRTMFASHLRPKFTRRRFPPSRKNKRQKMWTF